MINHLRSFGHSVEYCQDIKQIQNTSNNIIDSLVLKEAFEYLNEDKRNVGLIHQVDRTVQKYSSLELIVTGKAAEQDLIHDFNVARNQIHRVEPGIEQNWRKKTTHSKRIKKLLSVSNFVEGKGIDVLLIALGSLTVYEWQLKLVGNIDIDPEYFTSIQQLIHNLGLEDRIELIGVLSRDQINAIMIGSDLLVHFSERETYGMAIQESIQSHLPVLTYKTGAWEKFEKSGIVKVIPEYSQDTLKNELEKVFTSGLGLCLSELSNKNEKRTWEQVSRDIESIMINNLIKCC